LNIALMGSVSSTWFTLDALLRAGVDVCCAMGVDESRSDRVSDYRSIRALAVSAGVPFLPFVKVSEPRVEEFLRAHPPDQLWVIGLSQLVPKRLIELAPRGGVGFHPTLLPLGRGRAPVAWTILLEQPAAANLFHLTDEPDAGDIIVQRPVRVDPDDYAYELIYRTNLALADAIVELGPRIRSGDLPRTPQDHGRATFHARRTPEDGEIDFTQPAREIYKLIRAVGRPYPGAFTTSEGGPVAARPVSGGPVSDRSSHKLTIWRARLTDPEEPPITAAPGSVLRNEPQMGVLVATGDGGLWLNEIESDPAWDRLRDLTVGRLLGRGPGTSP
jgi:methionyl-tRNA formyltransferase